MKVQSYTDGKRWHSSLWKNRHRTKTLYNRTFKKGI